MLEHKDLIFFENIKCPGADCFTAEFSKKIVLV